MLQSLHRLAEARSLALHRLVAERIEQDPSLIQAALERVRLWERSGAMAPPYAHAWMKLLEGPPSELLAALRRDDEEMRALRQATPFVGILAPRERWMLWRLVRERWGER